LRGGESVPKNYTVEDVRVIFKKKSRKTIYRWIRKGIFKEVIKVPDGYLIPENEVARMIEERREIFS